MIPESVKRVTSATLKKRKKYETPVGEFIYSSISDKVFALGITQQSVDSCTYFYMASKEKALSDYLAIIKPFASSQELLKYGLEGVRIEEEALFKFRTSRVEEISAYYQKINVKLFCQILKK